MINKLRKAILMAFSFIIDNIHSICFLSGLTILNIAIYLVETVFGLLSTGLTLVLVGLLLNPKSGG